MNERAKRIMREFRDVFPETLPPLSPEYLLAEPIQTFLLGRLTHRFETRQGAFDVGVEVVRVKRGRR
jgi:hypothetical protein